MATNIKNIFNNAARNTGTFYNTFSGDIEYPDSPSSPSLPERIFKGVKEAAKTFSGKGGDYGNRMAAYNNYLNTLKYVKQSGQFSIKRGRVSTAPVTSRAGQVGGVKSTTFQDSLDKWNARFRKFAVTKYYESLTRGK